MSYGISTQYDFDREMAERGHEVDYPNLGARDRLLWIYPFLPNNAGKFALSLDSANPG